MKKYLFCTGLFLLIILPGFGADIILKELSGRVEIQQPDSSWTVGEAGMHLEKETKISTGFNSKAVLLIGGSTTTIQPLTRLTVENVESGEKEQKTALFLGAGRVRAEVKKSSDVSMDFSIRTPVATAAVRGTKFEVTIDSLYVLEGVVRFESGGYYTYVKQGGRASFKDGTLGSPIEGAFDSAMSSHFPSGDFSDSTDNRRTRGAAGDGMGQPIIHIR